MKYEVDLSAPVIWTTKGNLNERDCEIYVEWQQHHEHEEIVFIKHVFYQGEEVKREPFIFKINGLSTLVEQTAI